MALMHSSVSPRLHHIRGRQVILDSDLAVLFGVVTKRLNEQVRRNAGRFPESFAFRLSASEAAALRSQIATSNKGRGGRRSLPFVFTEYGVVMAANVLNSDRAISMSVEVVKAFVRLRKILRTNPSLRSKLNQIESAVKSRLDKHDADIDQLFKIVESLLGESPEEDTAKKRIGFAPQSL